jgi:hypothetical protein
VVGKIGRSLVPVRNRGTLVNQTQDERRRNESVQIEGKTVIEDGNVVKKGKSDVKSEAWKEVRNPC